MLLFVLVLTLAQAPSGATIFDTHCAACHSGTDARVPPVAALRERPPESIVDALVTGDMRQQGAELSDAERGAVAEYLTGRAPGSRGVDTAAARCAAPPPLNLSGGPRWNGWGVGVANTRFRPA